MEEKQNGATQGKGELRRGWIWTTLQEIAEIDSGYGFPKTYQGRNAGDLPFFKVLDLGEAIALGKNRLDRANNYVSLADCRKLRAKPLKAGSVVFAKIGGAIKLNRRAILSQDSLIDNNMMGVYGLPMALDFSFLYYFLRTVKLEEFSRATTVPSVRKADIEQISFPLAPLIEQHRIVTKIEELFSDLDAGIAALQKTKSELKRYRQAVLKAAVEGKLTAEWRAANAGKLEPASALLERIREERVKNANRKSKPLPPVDASELPELPEGWCWARVGEVGYVQLGRQRAPK